MNWNAPQNPKPIPHGETAELAARIQLSHMKVHRAVARKIMELAEGAGLTDHAISSTTGFPLPLIRLVLRGSPTLGGPRK